METLKHERDAQQRPGLNAGWRVLFALQRLWPRATQAERSPTMRAQRALLKSRGDDMKAARGFGQDCRIDRILKQLAGDDIGRE